CGKKQFESPEVQNSSFNLFFFVLRCVIFSVFWPSVRCNIFSTKHSLNVLNIYVDREIADVKKNLPDNPERFDPCVYVLAKQIFFSGRFYYEVQVKGKTHWTLGVAKESINRKEIIQLSPQNGYWLTCLRYKNKCKAGTRPAVSLFLESRPEKVGVFVDYEEGLVSFYDVDAAALIYSFTGCCFTQTLYPFFCPCVNAGGKNSAPLIISPVNHTE
uniref:B30.2/SPRY domain-containing protein n=1 Tax=Sparus aurata TaxID=8175 RepID=A0A671UED6_SPAAU